MAKKATPCYAASENHDYPVTILWLSLLKAGPFFAKMYGCPSNTLDAKLDAVLDAENICGWHGVYTSQFYYCDGKWYATL